MQAIIKPKTAVNLEKSMLWWRNTPYELQETPNRRKVAEA